MVTAGHAGLDLGSSVLGREGSSPFLRTLYKQRAVAFRGSCPLSSLHLILHLMDLSPNTPGYPCLMPTTTARILVLRAQGLTYAQIAAIVGLSTSRVGEIVRAHERRRILGLS